mmetsp:Transcript_8542/g.27895  ORF Transcript_8542/g.27895 Transcript_8542/m.27895 type:complete len:341 (-) Transcript_8542:1310-2332(-)
MEDDLRPPDVLNPAESVVFAPPVFDPPQACGADHVGGGVEVDPSIGQVIVVLGPARGQNRVFILITLNCQDAHPVLPEEARYVGDVGQLLLVGVPAVHHAPPPLPVLPVQIPRQCLHSDCQGLEVLVLASAQAIEDVGGRVRLQVLLQGGQGGEVLVRVLRIPSVRRQKREAGWAVCRALLARVAVVVQDHLLVHPLHQLHRRRPNLGRSLLNVPQHLPLVVAARLLLDVRLEALRIRVQCLGVAASDPDGDDVLAALDSCIRLVGRPGAALEEDEDGDTPPEHNLPLLDALAREDRRAEAARLEGSAAIAPLDVCALGQLARIELPLALHVIQLRVCLG